MTNHLEQRIAAELRAELARQDQSRHWLAEQTGIPVTTIARWLRGPQSPGLNDLDAMCRALGITIADLLTAVERGGPVVPAPRPPRVRRSAAAGTRGATDTRRGSGRIPHEYADDLVAA